MSYSPSTMSDGGGPPPDPRYNEWDTRSRKELTDRLNEAVDKRREATEQLIPRVIKEQLHNLGVNNIESISIDKDEEKIYRVSDEKVMSLTRKAIDQQIQDWKGLRWWRFNEKNACDSWNKWFKKAKCWQDQNQHKPLGQFWCLIFDELKGYTSDISNNIFPNNPRYKQALQNCLFAKCVEAILKGNVRFERTRETPLLPVRALTQSKELQQKLNAIDNGFTLSIWKQQAEAEHKRQKQQHRNSNRNGNGEKGQRANVATLLNERCGKHATNVYQRYVRSLAQIIPSLNIDMSAIESSMELNHNPYSSNSDYHPVTSYNENKNRYKYNPNEHKTTPAVFASLPNNMDMDVNTTKPNYNIPRSGYGATRGVSNSIPRAESHRYSPTLSSNSGSDTSSLSNDDAISSITSNSSSIHSSYSHRSNYKPPASRIRTENIGNMANMANISSSDGNTSQLDRLSQENDMLKAQLADIRRQLRHRSQSSEQQMALNTIVQQMQVQNSWNQYIMAQNMKLLTPPHIPSPLTVPVPPSMMAPVPPPPPPPPGPPGMPPIMPPPVMIPSGIPSSIPFNDTNGGHGVYTPKEGKMFYFPSQQSMDGGLPSKTDKINKNKNILNVDAIINNKSMNMDIETTQTTQTTQPGIYNDYPPYPPYPCYCDPPSDDIPYESTPDIMTCTPQTSGTSTICFENETQIFPAYHDYDMHSVYAAHPTQ